MSMPQLSQVEPVSKYDRLLARAKQVPPAKTIVVHPCDESSQRAALDAAEAGIIIPTFVGPAEKILSVARQHGFDLGRVEVVDAAHSESAATKAVELIREAKGELLMKGSLHTDELMRAVTASKTGLRTARRISHVFVVDVPTHSETLFITGRRHQHLPRSGRQARHHSERNRSVHPDRTWYAACSNPVRGRDGHV